MLNGQTMKYLARAFWLLGIASLVFGLVSCWRYQGSKYSLPPVRDTDGDYRPYVAFAGFFTGMLGGAVALSLGIYLRGCAKQARSSASVNEVLMVLRPRFCPKCGKPLRMSDCNWGTQFGFVPRLLCSECKVYAEHSGAIVFGLGVLLLLRACLIPAPERLEALSVISVPVGICLFLIGIIRMDRQHRKAKKYASRRRSGVWV
jgi:hypothetical protein